MEKIYVRGGNPLRGSLRVSGSKNASLALLAACLLVEGKTVLHDVPDIRDIRTMGEILELVGARVKFRADGSVEIDASGFRGAVAPEELARKMRASFYVLGPMLARHGEAQVAQPGGCNIGARPVDFHLKGLQMLGARIQTEGGVVFADTDRLRGARIYLDYPSAGATTHLMTTASLAEGVTVLQNAAQEPEVEDVANFLNHLGAKITGAGTSTIYIEGVDRLATDRDYTVIPDRMEAGTFACAAAITRGDVILENVTATHLQPVLVKLQEMGVDLTALTTNPDKPGLLRVAGKRKTTATDLVAMPHPSFPTDMQQPMVALLAVSEGAARVTDLVFENRFAYVNELSRMAADIRVDGRTAFVHGVETLKAAPVSATDLRAGAALVVAALAAEGETIISGVEHLDRGYAGMVEKLLAAGGDIDRVDTDHIGRYLAVV